MTRAIALGYQGFGNVGDEAILAGIEELLAGTSIDVTAVIGGREPIAAFASARRVSTRRLRPTRSAITALRGQEVMIISGGGLLHDHWWTVVPTYLAWSILARLAGARIAWIGVGIGPLRSWWSRRLAGLALRLASLVTVRDVGSARLARAIAPGITVREVPDPAFLLRAPAPAERTGFGFVVRAPAPRDAELAPALAGLLGKTAAAAARDGMPVAILTFGGGRDLPFAEMVVASARSALGPDEGPGSAPIPVEQLEPDPAHVLARLASFEALVTVRLHGLILAAIAGTPAVPVVYDPKVAAIANQLGIGDLCLELHEVASETPETVLGRVHAMQDADRRSAVAASVDRMRRSVDELRAAMVGIMDA